MEYAEGDLARFCVVGLGNPGEEYNGTRHNVGFEVVDMVAARAAIDIRRPEFRALTAAVRICRSMVIVMKPQEYMNCSGRSVADALGALGIPASGLVVVHDDLDLPLGRLRIRVGGGSGGHRGVASVLEEVGDDRFVRVRVGVGRPAPGIPTVEYVLTPFTKAEADEAAQAVSRAADAVTTIVCECPQAAMEKFNRAV